MLRPTVFSKPQAVLSVQVVDRPGACPHLLCLPPSGARSHTSPVIWQRRKSALAHAGLTSVKHFAAIDSSGHAATLRQAGSATAAGQVIQALSGVTAAGVGASALQHAPLAAIPGCSDLCMQELLKV